MYEVGDKVLWTDPQDPEDGARRGVVTKIHNRIGRTVYDLEWFDGSGGVGMAHPNDMAPAED